jgi:protein AATF/BFR2
MQLDSDNDPFAPVDDDDVDDPFANHQDADGDSDDDEIEPDDTSMADDDESGVDEDEEAMSRDQSDSASDIEMDGADTDESDATSISSQSDSGKTAGPGADRKALLDLMKADTARVAATLSSSEDVKQGKAVRQQKNNSDRLLDARIKFQKGLAASKELFTESVSDDDARAAIAKAESAALALWSTLDSIRSSFLQNESDVNRVQTEKHKQSTPLRPDRITSSSAIFQHLKGLDSAALEHRRMVLDHWSRRTRPVAASQSRSSNPYTAPIEPSLTEIIDEYMARDANKRTTPDQDDAHSNVSFSDDAFYQSLLRDLIASRTDINFTGHANTQSQSKPAPVNNQRNRRNVDTKASKGRKLRYTVHEKLVSFMASEDRTTWSDAARVEFFGSLFGGKLANGQNHDDELDGLHGSAYEHANGEAPLRLF